MTLQISSWKELAHYNKVSPHSRPLLYFQHLAVKMSTVEVLFCLFNLITMATCSCPIETLNRVVHSVLNITSSFKFDGIHNEDLQNFAVIEYFEKELQSEDILRNLQASDEFRQYQSAIATAQNSILNVNDIFKNFQAALNDKDRRNARNQFTKHYRFQSIDPHLWYLTEQATGTSTMPLLISKELKCNMTAIRRFEKSYSSLILNGIVLNCIYTNMTGGDTESEVNDLLKNMNDCVGGLLRAEKFCMDHYPDYAIIDLKEANSVQALHQTVEEKYPSLQISATFYHPVRSFRYHAIYANYSRTKNVFQVITESKNKVMTFCVKGHNLEYTDARVKILQRISTYKGARTGDSDPDAAMHILDAIIDTARTFGIYPYAVTIIPHHSSFPIKESITGYCDNEIYLIIYYDTVFEDSFWSWNRHTYFDVEYHIRIYLPTRDIGASINDLTHTYKVEKTASWKPTASKIILISLILFTIEILNVL